MGAAKGCAAALVTGDQATFAPGNGVTAPSGGCAAGAVYKSDPDGKLGTDAEATVGTNGEV